MYKTNLADYLLEQYKSQDQVQYFISRRVKNTSKGIYSFELGQVPTDKEVTAAIKQFEADNPPYVESCRECGGVEFDNYAAFRSAPHDNGLCFDCDFWTNYVNRKDESHNVRINGDHYRIGSEDVSPNECKGFSGQKFIIHFFDGRKEVTTNLWEQGTIPERFRDRLPDNARFI
ncbi:MAG: hypothetical protein IIC75_00430 [Bacteroidetes bacterium]|nr:hypothetical protein [Bacteroidota bacterium]